MLIGDRIRHYTREVPICLALGRGTRDKICLLWSCLGFHAANITGLKPYKAAKTYNVQLTDLVVSLMLRSYSGDIFIFHEVLDLRCYNIQLPQTEGIVVDLGANIGLASLYFADLYKPRRLLCVEPNPLNIPLLRYNLSSLGAGAEIVHAAIADATGVVQFDCDAPSWGGKIVDKGACVPSYSMSDFVRTFVSPDRIRLLKVDIEGAEQYMFRGNLEWLNVVDCIIIELHPGMSLRDLADLVGPYGLEVLPQGSEYGNMLPIAIRGDHCEKSRSS